jgi:hypothetical protein
MYKEVDSMKHRYAALLIVPVILLAIIVAESSASVEWTPGKVFKLEKSPIDAAFSTNGRWVFVLTDDGNVLVYSAEGKLADTIAVGTDVDGIRAGREEQSLFLISRQKKTVEEIVLNFTYDIDISGSPFKGKAAAPVVITVFNDYQ